MSDSTYLAQPAQLPDSPYPGIDPYSYADRGVYSGRETEARDLFRLVVIYRGVLLYSNSGVGKSSLLNAGLVPLALSEGYQPQRVRVTAVQISRDGSVGLKKNGAFLVFAARFQVEVAILLSKLGYQESGICSAM
jgi:hypothetical protein